MKPAPFTYVAPSTIAAALGALGEEAFAAAWIEGRALTVEQAINLAQAADV